MVESQSCGWLSDYLFHSDRKETMNRTTAVCEFSQGHIRVFFFLSGLIFISEENHERDIQGLLSGVV